jgi:ferritin-like metal-binding protein YciE
MAEIIDKVKEKAKDVKDVVVDTAKSLPHIDVLNQKFALELNGALAMENAGIARLQTRVQEVSIPEAKQRMLQHIAESLEHQKTLQQLVSGMGAEPTLDKMGLPLPEYPPNMLDMMKNTMTKQEWELKRSEEDLILEKAEVTCYFMLIQKIKMVGGMFLTAVDPLSKNMDDEQNMAEWIRTNSPGMMAQLWPKIQSAVATASSPTSTQSPTQSQ